MFDPVFFHVCLASDRVETNLNLYNAYCADAKYIVELIAQGNKNTALHWFLLVVGFDTHTHTHIGVNTLLHLNCYNTRSCGTIATLCDFSTTHLLQHIIYRDMFYTCNKSCFSLS